MFTKKTSPTAKDAWVLIEPKGDIEINRLYENEDTAWRDAGERMVGYSAWKDLNAVRRKLLLEAGRMEGWRVLKVQIHLAS